MSPLPSILFCLDYYWPHVGGGEVLFTGLCEGLAARGWQVTVLTQGLKGLPAHEERHGVRIVRHWSRSRYVFTWASLPTLLKLTKKADLLHCETFAAAPPSWLVSKLRRLPLVLTVHELWIGKWHHVSDASAFSNGCHEIIERLLHLPDYGNYVAVSQATAGDLAKHGIPKEKIHTIYNGLDYSFWSAQGHDRAKLRNHYGFSSDEYIFMYSGRPGCSKGLPYLVQAFAQIAQRYPRATLVAKVSNGATVRKDYLKLLKLIQELELKERIRLIPPMDFSELPGFTLCADAVVVPSLCEGFGFVAAEACAMGRPVIASHTASLPEVVSGAHLLIQPRSVEALVQAMEKALMGAWDMTPPRRFPLSQMVDNYINLYSELLHLS